MEEEMARYCPVCKGVATSHLATHCGCDGQLHALVSTPDAVKNTAVSSRGSARCSACGGTHPTFDEDGQPCGNLPGGGNFFAPSSQKQRTM